MLIKRTSESFLDQSTGLNLMDLKCRLTARVSTWWVKGRCQRTLKIWRKGCTLTLHIWLCKKGGQCSCHSNVWFIWCCFALKHSSRPPAVVSAHLLYLMPVDLTGQRRKVERQAQCLLEYCDRDSGSAQYHGRGKEAGWWEYLVSLLYIQNMCIPGSWQRHLGAGLLTCILPAGFSVDRGWWSEMFSTWCKGPRNKEGWNM